MCLEAHNLQITEMYFGPEKTQWEKQGQIKKYQLHNQNY